MLKRIYIKSVVNIKAEAVMITKSAALFDVIGNPKDLLNELRLITTLVEPNFQGIKKEDFDTHLELGSKNPGPMAVQFVHAKDTVYLLNLLRKRNSPIVRYNKR